MLVDMNHMIEEGNWRGLSVNAVLLFVDRMILLSHPTYDYRKTKNLL